MNSKFKNAAKLVIEKEVAPIMDLESFLFFKF
jgi:hypothetical protein